MNQTINFKQRYFDKQQATINALKDYPNMQKDQQLTPTLIRQKALTKIQNQQHNKTSPPTKTNTPTDPTGNQATQLLNEQQKLTQRQQTATQYMNWFLPAWNTLDQLHRDLLQAIYLTNTPTTQVIQQAAQTTGKTTRTIYRTKNQALKQLAQKLYDQQTSPNTPTTLKT